MRASEAIRPAWYRRRFAFQRIVTHDFPLKAAAVLIAVLFWIATAQNATPRTVTLGFDGRLPVERPEIPVGYVLRGQLGDVGVTLRGPEGAVSRVAVGDLRATVDMSAVDPARAEPQDAPVRVAATDPAVTVVDVSPAAVTLRFERITSQTLTVQTKFANQPPTGSHAGDATISPTQVKVTGPESSVAQIAAVLATVRFGDAMTDITQTAPVVPVDKAGQPVDGLATEPSVVIVTVPVLPTATTRTVPIVYVLRGAIAPGYWVSGVTTDPPGVTVRGEPEVLATLDRIETVAIDVNGLAATRTVRVALLLPQGATLLRPTDVAVTVTLQPLTGTRAFQSATQVVGLPAGLVAETDPQSVAVIVAGPMQTLGGMGADQVTATVDASGLAPGAYVRDVAIRVLPGTSAQLVQPARVTLTIRNK